MNLTAVGEHVSQMYLQKLQHGCVCVLEEMDMSMVRTEEWRIRHGVSFYSDSSENMKLLQLWWSRKSLCVLSREIKKQIVQENSVVTSF